MKKKCFNTFIVNIKIIYPKIISFYFFFIYIFFWHNFKCLLSKGEYFLMNIHRNGALIYKKNSANFSNLHKGIEI